MTRAGRLVVCAVGVGPSDGDTGALLAEAEAGVARAAKLGAGLVVLPELFALPYYAGESPGLWRGKAETLEGPTVSWAQRAAREYGVSLIYGLPFETGRERPANAALLTRPQGATTWLASKSRLPPARAGDLFGEADHFEPGPPDVAVAEIEGVRVAALVCYDRRFPESWRRAAEAGADVVAVLVAGEAPDDPSGFFARELSGHAAAHALPAIAAARYGVETRLSRPVRHDGETLAVTAAGEILPAAVAPNFARLSATTKQSAEETP